MAKQATHKLQHAGVFVRTGLGSDELLRLTEQVARETRGIGMYRKSPIRISVTSRGPGSRAFAVVNGKNKTRLRFQAASEPADDAPATQLGTKITMFQTRQNSFLGFIPAGPKQLVHYHFYEQYMLGLKAAIEAQDAGADVEIRERG